MKQIKMNYSPGPPSHPLTSKRGKRSWARTNTTLGNKERKVASSFLEPRKPVFLRLALPLTYRGITRQWGADKSPLAEGHLRPCCSLESSGEENGPHGRTLASGAAQPSGPGRPELRPLPSRRSRSSRPSRSHAGPPPAIAPATTSVPLNRFLLHVNTYYRKGEDGAAAHYPEDIFRGSRRSGGSEGNLRTSERGPLSCPRTVVCTSLGTTNPESDPQLPPRAHLPLASPPRCSSLASKPRRWGSTDPPRGRSGAQRPPPRSRRPRTRRSRARAAASWAVAAPARALPLGCASGTPAGPGPRTRWLLRGLRGGLGRPRPQERPVPAPTPATSLLTLSRASAPSFPSGHIP
uniref:uncharacterized protein LOC129521174 n=1 Tax=Nyctereutes procyonoides TaxID=34880 RepID=UPI0024440133|nr:uncharacterized protein LOC129521174 [Nyctereutes procyonoides]